MYNETAIDNNIRVEEQTELFPQQFFSTLDKLEDNIAEISEKELLTTRLKPLTKEEEQILFTGRIKCQKKIEELNGNNPEQKESLLNLKQNTEELLVAYNMGLIRSCVREAIRRRSVEKRLFYKLFTPGLEGLYVAIEYFDPSLNNKFSTLALPVISQRINEFIDFFQRSIDITHTQNEKFITLSKAEEQFIQDYHRLPKRQELLNYAQEKYGSLGNKQFFLSALNSKRRVFLDDDYFPNSSTDSMKNHEKISKPYKNPEQIIETNETNQWVLDFLNTLSKRDKNLIYSLWGINDGTSKTQRAVSKEFNLSQERVRQIEEKTYEKMTEAWLNQNPYFLK